MRRKARVQLNFFEYSDSKSYHVEPDVVEYDKDSERSMTLFLALWPWKSLVSS